MTIPESESMVEDGVCDSPCSPEEQRRIVTDLNSEAESNLKEGNLYFLISSRWYTSWQIFVGLITEEEHGGEASEVTRPGPIDNHDIIESESRPQLLKKLEEGVDYALVPLEVWSKLFEWYKGGPPIKRKMICHKSYSVEVYQLCLNVIDGRDDSCTIITLSKQASISQLYKIVSAVTGVAEKKARIWDYLEKKKRVFLDPSSDKNLEESNLVTDQDILLEIDVSEYEASWSEDEVAGETVRNGKSKLSLFERNSPKDDGCDSLSASAKDKMRGLVGLLNLGNTCFMNSTLQCLAHTPPIVEYFVQDYSNDINADNPLGTRGELAVAFGELLKTLWSSDQNAVAPQDFKAKLAQFAPQFSGYGQHDSQEMLAFLLDGLHEDLNKVKRKPYIEARDSNGRSDDELAEEAWKYHKARNDSVIVDVCQGQYKSTLVCPDCGKISIAFDPFMYLSLPFPSSNTRSLFSCLEAFLAEEPLGQDDMWYCPACKEHKQANKKLDLWKLPDILVFHLKRFMFNSHLKNKINTFVNFPIHDLDLSKYVKSKDGQTYLYNLYAISNHYGAMGSGHYTAYAKLMEENKWYDFNDRLVTATDESEIKTSAAYVLFYQRVKSESATSKMDVD
ncbi:unnamed protein product [Cochlearia groenlandica]